jgi:4-alpha-glucanotransferase
LIIARASRPRILRYPELVKFPREAGILLHPTSLSGRFGIGDLGPEAYRFADFLQTSGMHVWQVLPLGPTGYGDSPYQSFSAFAGNSLLISPDRLAGEGLLTSGDLAEAPDFPEETVEFETVLPWKRDLLRRAFGRFRPDAGYDRFCEENAWWLDDFGRFMALKEANDQLAWTQWKNTGAPSQREIDLRRFEQFCFAKQWRELKRYCADRGIRVMGDIPIYVAHDSADVWAHRDLFELDARGNPTVVAGVPPDYFSADGQLWGNPIYRWEHIEATGWKWWIDRLRHTLTTVDMVRLDHFRGFEAYWEVPAGEKTARHGRWVKGPGAKLFQAVEKALGRLPIVAENLGVITPEVEAIRNQFGYPGMSVLQFAFGTDPQAPTFRPHNYPREVVAYTGTHDNDTTIGWWNSQAAADSTRSYQDIEEERAFTLAYLHTDGREINWDFIRTVIASVADTAIVPMQDVLGLGSRARMNLPGSTRNHWRWRMRADAITSGLSERLGRLNKLYDR